jgi:DHA3 family multidrug efflux protein-like MFS transporter
MPSGDPVRPFLHILGNTIAAAILNALVWFGATFWVYLETQSVIATSVMAGIYTVTVAGSGFLFGAIVDRFRKKTSMLISSGASLALFGGALALKLAAPDGAFADAASPWLWAFVVVALAGSIVGNIRSIALLTVVPLLFPEEGRDRANGMAGTATGISFLGGSVLSGLGIGYLGMVGTMALAVAGTVLVIGHLLTLRVPDLPMREQREERVEQGGIDLRGTIAAIALVPGLFALIFFQTFNNFLGGIFMSLLDAYGLQLVSVQEWGAIFGALSLAFIVGGALVARRGLGRDPLRTLFLSNLAMWGVCCVFALQANIVLLMFGMFFWFALSPAVEAAEQTVLQAVVPAERQGRVFGFAQSVEQSASPITSFVIGPVAQLIFIPFMTTGAGVELIGAWFGAGPNRGIGLLFTLAGFIGFAATMLAMRSRAYRSVAAAYTARFDRERELVAA